MSHNYKHGDWVIRGTKVNDFDWDNLTHDGRVIFEAASYVMYDLMYGKNATLHHDIGNLGDIYGAEFYEQYCAWMYMDLARGDLEEAETELERLQARINRYKHTIQKYEAAYPRKS